MLSIHIDFTRSAWWLLLLIPAVILTLIPYFRLSKKYRRTRNRIVSMVLHMTVMVLCVLALAGLQFTYQANNLENEIILLVDVSETSNEKEEQRDEFIQTVLDEGQYDGYKIGIVTFGFTQEYAVPLTYDVESIYDAYLAAPLPDTSATDIAAALTYTKDLFTNPETSKIVLITDGKETDESALGIIGTVSAQGTKVDTAYIATSFEKEDIQVTGVTYPDYYVGVGDECPIGVSLQSNGDVGDVTVSLYDNGELASSQTVGLSSGSQTISFTHAFASEGLHEMSVRVTREEDRQENNEYYSYIYLDRYNHILVLEQLDGESDALESLLKEEEAGYDVEVQNIREMEIPADINNENDPSLAEAAMQELVDSLRQYDQIILNNIANADMPAGLDEALYTYVSVYGGGLFTVGGNGANGEAHAYNRTDMFGSLYQEMLPVEVINYTPPVGVMVIIDVSGSMTSDGAEGQTKLWWAQQGAISCLDALTERDYIGIMTLDETYSSVLGLTSVTREETIRKAIYSIQEGTATNYTNAISRAGEALVANQDVSKRHIIIVTDGMPGDSEDDYLAEVRRHYQNNGITVSVMCIGASASSPEAAAMQAIVDEGHGRLHLVTDLTNLQEEMREDLNAPEIEEINYESFYPIISNPLSPLLNGVEYGVDGASRRVMTVELDGFYGVKLKTRVSDPPELILMGDYQVPIYAQWKFGEGMVGSFMCDLNGTWSSSFMADANGKRFLWNAVEGLMPTSDIRPKNITVSGFTEDNYINSLGVITDLEDGQYVRGTVIKMDGNTETDNVLSLNETTPEEDRAGADSYVTESLGSENQYSRCSFVVKAGAVYKILLEKCNADGTVVDTLEFYKSFSYSAEYDTFADDGDRAAFLSDLSYRTSGNAIGKLDNPWEIFADFITAVNRTFDPTAAMIIAAIVLFLLDIAVRKFKFKWIHELVREHKEKKAREKAGRPVEDFRGEK